MTKALEDLFALSCNVKHRNVDMSDKKVGWIYRLDDIFHLGHVASLITLSTLTKEGCSLEILFEDSDYNIKVKKDAVELKFKFLEKLVLDILTVLQVNKSKIKIFRSSELRNTKEYVMDFYKLVSIISEKESLVALNKESIVKMGDLLFPVLRLLDSYYLNVDYIFTGVHHEKIFLLADKKFPELGFKNLKVILHECIDGIKGKKMSKNDLLNNISLVDTKKGVEKKIKKIFCEEGNKKNVLMGIYKLIVFPFVLMNDGCVEIKDIENKVTVYKRYEDLEKDFVLKKIHPGDLKTNCSRYINNILDGLKSKIKEDEKVIKTIFNIK